MPLGFENSGGDYGGPVPDRLEGLMDTNKMTDHEIRVTQRRLAEEERERRLRSKEYRAEVQDDLEKASKAASDISTDLQYSGPTMYSHSPSELTSHISKLSLHTKNLLWLLERKIMGVS